MTQAQDVVPIEPDKPTVPLLPQPKFDLKDTVYFVYKDDMEVECPKCVDYQFLKVKCDADEADPNNLIYIACPFCLDEKKTTEFQWTTWVATVMGRMAMDRYEGHDYIDGRYGRLERSVQYTLRLPDHGANTRGRSAPSSIYEADAFATTDEAETEAAARNEKGA